MNLRETGFGDERWTELGEGRVQDLVSVMRLQFVYSN
jgi:hypothetical protein